MTVKNEDELPMPVSSKDFLINSDDSSKKSKPVSTANEESYSSSYIFQVVSFYWLTSLSIVFLNKYILSTSEYKFPYPVFVTWFQLLVALTLLIVFGELGKR